MIVWRVLPAIEPAEAALGIVRVDLRRHGEGIAKCLPVKTAEDFVLQSVHAGFAPYTSRSSWFSGSLNRLRQWLAHMMGFIASLSRASRLKWLPAFFKPLPDGIQKVDASGMILICRVQPVLKTLHIRLDFLARILQFRVLPVDASAQILVYPVNSGAQILF